MLHRSGVLALLLLVLASVAGCSSHSPQWQQYYQERERLAEQFTNWVEQAEQGNREAGYLVAYYYEHGIGWDAHQDGKMFLHSDPQKSSHWYRKAAEAGDPRALWVMRERAKDVQEERYWIELGTELNDAASLYTRGLAYAHVDDTNYKVRHEIYPRDMEQATHWFEKAIARSEQATSARNEAERFDSLFKPGNADRAAEPDRIQARASEQLGRIYKEGAEGVARDRTKALEYFLEAYRLSGSIWLPKHIADIYRSGGDGVETDFDKARRWGTRYYDAYMRAIPSSRDRYQKEKADFLAEIAIEERFAADSDLPADIREDKYKQALAGALRAGDHNKALVYFDYLERIEATLPDSMLFFRGNAFLKAGEPQQAKQYLLDYINAEGKQGNYYRKALELLNQADL